MEVVVADPTAEEIWAEEAAKLDADKVKTAEDKPPQVEAKTEPEPETKPEAPADPMEEMRTRMGEIEKLANRMRNVEGHIGGLTSVTKKLNDTLAAATAARKSVDEAPTAAQVKTAIENPKQWEALKQDFPEWAEATEAFVDAKLGGFGSQDPAAIERIVNERIEVARGDMRKEIVETALEGVHPGWRDTINTTDFTTWFNGQPTDVQALAASDKISDASRMLSMFANRPQARAQEISQQRAGRLSAAAAAPGKGGVASPGISTDDMTPEQLWNYEAAQRDKSRASRGY